jgi:hypothetical protein
MLKSIVVVAGVLVLTCAQTGFAQAPTAPTLAPTAAPTAAPTLSGIVRLKLDLDPNLSSSRGRLETTLTAVSGTQLKGRAEFREGVVLLAAADAARKLGDKTSANRLATEANTRFDLAVRLAVGGTGTSAGLTALSKDATVGKFVTPAMKDVVAPDPLVQTPTTWSQKGFEPMDN